MGSILFLLAALTGPTRLYAQAAVSPGATRGLSLVEAVQSTLQSHPLLKLQGAEVEISRGKREQASSIFDSTIQSGLSQQREVTPLPGSQLQQNGPIVAPGFSQASNVTGYNVNFTRLFRNGVTAGSIFDVGRNTDNLSFPGGVNTSTVNLIVSLPLLRGRGRNVTAAQERASIAEVDATLLDMNQLMAQLISSATVSYWNLVAARKKVAIAFEAEERGRIYLQNVQALVQADHVPRNDLNEVTANIAQRTSARIAFEQDSVAAEAQLALDMGIQADRILDNIKDLTDDFPDGEDQSLPSISGISLAYYLEQALEHRPDLLAAQRRSAEAGMVLTAAQNKLLPQLNLSFGAGYSGMEEGRNGNSFFTAPFTNIGGPNAYVGLTYLFSGKNQAARGASRQANAARQQAGLKSDEVARNISAQVMIAVQAVRNAILRLKKAREAVEAFQAALAGERDKYRAGIGSIVNVLTVEDKLDSTLAEQIDAQQAYALALIQFRFATGTLIPAPDQPAQNIKADTLVTLPFTTAPGARP